MPDHKLLSPPSSTVWKGFRRASVDYPTATVVLVAALSAFISTVSPNLSPLYRDYWSYNLADPIPGVAFGLVLVFMLMRFGIRSITRLTFVVVSTVLVWLIAYEAAKLANDAWRITWKISFGSDTVVTWTRFSELKLLRIITLLGGGLTGGLGTFLVVATIARPVRQLNFFTKMVAVGAVSAMMAEFCPNIFNPDILSPLFLIWQVAVAIAVEGELRSTHRFDRAVSVR